MDEIGELKFERTNSVSLKLGKGRVKKLTLFIGRLNLIKKLRLPMRFINRGNERLMSLLLPIRIKSEKEGENNNHFPIPAQLRFCKNLDK